MINKKGFTFIELLISVAIILLLTSAAVVFYQPANKKARDNKRKTDLEQIRAALEMYRADNDLYPVGGWSTMTNALSGGNYLNDIPQDPKAYSYYYNSDDGLSYSLCAFFESGGDDDCGDNCNAPGGQECNYKLTNP